MILPFSTQIKDKPTYFVEKVLKGLRDFDFSNSYPSIRSFENNDCVDLSIYFKCNSKIHTIREDKNNRWKPGVMIDFFINARQKNMFRFAPRIPVVSTQSVFMTYAYNDIIEISVDNTYINNREEFAKNDGFDTWEDFFNYFYPLIKKNEDEFFVGKIIHWTDKRY